ncbi:AAA family ATPase [Corynebacterium sp. TAE3-ERU16]|nr:AAA family ATPase [Corynebacterium sp. TAE3-ERU16]
MSRMMARARDPGMSPPDASLTVFDEQLPPTSRVCVVVAPACAGGTSSLETTRSAWENPGKTVLGLVLTGKAAGVMEGER